MPKPTTPKNKKITINLDFTRLIVILMRKMGLEPTQLESYKILSLALDKELTFKTVFRYRHIYPMAIDAVAAGKVNLKGIVTDVFGLDEVQKAMDYSVNHKADIVKAVIRIAE